MAVVSSAIFALIQMFYSGGQIAIFMEDLNLSIISPVIVIENIIKFVFLYIVVVKMKNAFNKYAVVIYSISIGIGIGIVKILQLAFLENIVVATIWIVDSLAINMVFQVFMAYFLIKGIEKNKVAVDDANKTNTGSLFKELNFYYIFALFVPMLCEFIYAWNEVSQYGFNFGFIFLLLFVGVLYFLSYKIINYEAMTNVVLIKNKHNKVSYQRDGKSFKDIISYRFDSMIRMGNSVLILWLIASSILLMLIITYLIMENVPEVAGGNYFSAFRISFMRVLDAGNLNNDIAYNNGKFLFISTMATIVGIVITAVLIAIIVNQFDKRLKILKKGNAKVIEKNHLAIVGYNKNVDSLLLDLFVLTKKKLTVVILSDIERDELEIRLAGIIPINSNLKLICRKGDVTSNIALKNISITEASDIVVVGNDDMTILKSSIVIKNMIIEKEKNAIISTIINSEASYNTAYKELGDRISVVLNTEMNYKPLKKTVLQRDYIKVYEALINMNGCNTICTHKVKQLIGKTVGEICNSFWESSFIGIVKSGNVILNPERSTIIEQEDSLIFIKKSNRQIRIGRKPQNRNVELFSGEKELSKVNYVLIIGDIDKDNIIQTLKNENAQIKVDILPIYDEEKLETLLYHNQYDNIFLLGQQVLINDQNQSYEMMSQLLFIKAILKKRDTITHIMTNVIIGKDKEFLYKNKLVDYILLEDKLKVISNQILEKANNMSSIEKALFDKEKGLALIGYKESFDDNGTSIQEVYEWIERNNMLFIGYGKNVLGEIKITLNPNRNEKIRLKTNDFLIVVK